MAQRELIGRMLACLAEDLGMHATAPVCAVEPNTIVPWLVEAAETSARRFPALLSVRSTCA